MANCLNIQEYSPSQNEEFFFDTNVWIYLLIPALSHNQLLEQKYAAFWGKIRNKKAKVFTSFVVISEFVNRYLRNELKNYNKFNNCEIDYKTFKQKKEYEENFKYITNLVLQVILPNCELIAEPQEIIQDNSCLYNYIKNCDLNDNYIIEIAKYYECCIVSSDKYMANTKDNIKVISA